MTSGPDQAATPRGRARSVVTILVLAALAIAVANLSAGIASSSTVPNARTSGQEPAIAMARATVRAADGLTSRTVTVAGERRSYEIHRPRAAAGRRPVVIMLHGGGGSGSNAARMTGFNELADQEGFLAVYPNGSGVGPLTWNADHCCGYALRNEVDDVAFISALIDDLVSRGEAERRRIYVTGMSNGAMMAHRVGRELPDRVAAIAPVVGAVFGDEPRTASPVPALIITGKLDRNVPREGGYGAVTGASDAPYAPARAAFRYWRAGNDCAGAKKVKGTPVFRLRRGKGCDAPVKWYLLKKGTHSWPGGRPSHRGGDEPVQDFDASRVIWRFFDGKRLH
ncbi:MAG: extracellular catalytic domain type 1 short-chain-length polyhydroxyalkanoate depolymerase [Nocardioides sp.]